jgi:hypothetical protein
VANGHGPVRTAVKWDLETAARAAATEADLVPFAFTYKGADYTVPPQRKWPVKALVSVAAGQLDEALPALLGKDAFAAMCDAGLDVGEMTALFDKLAEAAGMGNLPNSGPPPQRGSTRT